MLRNKHVVEIDIGRLDCQLSTIRHRITRVHRQVHDTCSICPGSALTRLAADRFSASVMSSPMTRRSRECSRA
jgi:hypothetical protein